MKTIQTYLLWSLFIIFSVEIQANSLQKLILITIDGVRWQEVFTGASSHLLHDKQMLFWHENPKVRRRQLMPFLWDTIAKDGAIFGNKNEGNQVQMTNGEWGSYAGYNEIFAGYVDQKRIHSNMELNNPNITFLEYLNRTPTYKRHIAVFTSWYLFPFIFNEQRSRLHIDSGQRFVSNSKPLEYVMNRIQANSQLFIGNSYRLDTMTHELAITYLKDKMPQILYIAYDNTDSLAHRGNYLGYLQMLQMTDGFIQEIWNFVQNHPFYKNQTTLLIITDHGRGHDNFWQHHQKIPEASQIWFAVLGNQIKAQGEVKTYQTIYATQIFATVFQILGLPLPHDERINKQAINILKD